MLCADVEDFSEQKADELVERALQVQHREVGKAIHRVLTDRPDVDRIVLSGSGEVLGRNLATRIWPTLPMSSLAEQLGPELSQAACAYAVACLAASPEFT
jgi:uncharacterized hydantoinase/oxoprolinase family protein